MPRVTRRAALAGLMAAPPFAAARKVLVGAHPWVFAARRPANDIYPILDQVFSEIASAGVDGIELMHTVLTPDGAVERVRELSKRYRLPVIGTSWSAPMWNREQHSKIMADAERLLPRLQEVGGRTLGVSVGDARRKKTPEEFDAQAGILRKVMKLSSDHGVVVNLHNHVYEVRDGEYDLSNTLRRVPEVKLGPDLNWLLRAGLDPVDFIRRRGRQIVFAHLRDQKADGKWPEAMGEGDMDYAAIGQALREVNFQGDLVIELAHERDFQPTRSYGESFRLSREYVRRAMKY